MPDWPAVPLFLFLVAIAAGRGGLTYALGRAARTLADRTADTRRSEAVVRGERIVERFGAPAVTLCFLTIGIQTAVNAAAGALRMPLRRYLPALLLGALLWATAYFTIGFAIIHAIWGSGRGWLLVGVLAVLVPVVYVVRRRFARAHADRPSPDESAAGEPEPPESPS